VEGLIDEVEYFIGKSNLEERDGVENTPLIKGN